MPIKGLEKGDGVWGRGKEPFLKRFFPLPQCSRIDLQRQYPLEVKNIYTEIAVGFIRNASP